jgi:predicted RNA polymerase sigma factor
LAGEEVLYPGWRENPVSWLEKKPCILAREKTLDPVRRGNSRLRKRRKAGIQKGKETLASRIERKPWTQTENLLSW